MASKTPSKVVRILKAITRDEYGTSDQGYLATPLDRCEIVREFPTNSSGGKNYEVKNEGGELFTVTTTGTDPMATLED